MGLERRPKTLVVDVVRALELWVHLGDNSDISCCQGCVIQESFEDR